MARLHITVNGRAWTGTVPEGARLLDVLRDQIGLTGTKAGCGEGQCGSCTVLVGGRAVRACMTTPQSGLQVVTVEGLEREGRLHPLQQAFIDAQAFQCGFCTPGMILGAAALLSRHPTPTRAQIIQALDGHLCRCGAYPRIIEAVTAAARTLRQESRRG